MSEARPESKESAPDSIPLIEGRVRAEWVSPVGQMTPEHYGARFGQALAELLEKHLNLGADAADAGGTHVAVLQSATHYLDPLREGEQFNVEARMLGWSPTHMRVFFTMWREDRIAATCEHLLRNTSNSEPGPVPFPAAAGRAIGRMYDRQSGLPLPREAGQTIVVP